MAAQTRGRTTLYLLELTQERAEMLGIDPSELRTAPTVAAVEADLRRLKKRDRYLAAGAVAAAARRMAEDLDSPWTSPTARSMCVGRLQDAMAALNERAPPESTQDELDDLHARRERRRTQGAPGAGSGDVGG